MSAKTASSLRAATYARVSSDEQAEKGFSLPEQAESLAAYCQRHELEHVGHFSDDLPSDLAMEARPGLREVERLAVAGALDLLVCVRLDRLSRINHIRRGIEEDLEDKRVQVVYADQRFDATSTGRFQKGIMGQVYEYQLEYIREQCMMGRVGKAKNRQVMPGNCNPFGYNQITKAEAAVIPEYAGRDGELLVDEGQAEVIRSIFRRYAHGEDGIRRLALWLNAQGVKSAKGGKWSIEVLRRLLSDDGYVSGIRYYGKQRWVRKRGKMTITPRPREEWIPVRCPAIVSPELWEAAQRRMGNNKAWLANSGKAGRAPLSGVVFCGTCQYAMSSDRLRLTRASGKGPPRYRCNSIQLLRYCGTSIRADELEQAAITYLSEIVTPGWIERYVEETYGGAGAAIAQMQERIERLNADLLSTYSDEEGIADLITAKVSGVVWRGKLDAIHAKRAALESELEAEKGSLLRTRDPGSIQAALTEATDSIRWLLEKRDPSMLREAFLFLDIAVRKGEKPEIRLARL